MTSNHPAYEELVAYAAGDLNTEQAEIVREHARACQVCPATIARFQSAQSSWKATPFESPSPATIARAYGLFKPRRALKRSRLPVPLSRFPEPGLIRFPQLFLRSTVTRVLAGLVLATVLLLGGTGVMVAAAQDSLPGDLLYPVKTGDEALQLAVSQDSIGKTELHLHFAEHRINEIQALTAQGRFGQVAALASAYERELGQGVDELELASRDHPSRAAALLPQVEQALARNTEVLSVVRDTLPANSKADLENAINLSKASLFDVQNKVPTATPSLSPTTAAPTETRVPTATVFNTVPPTPPIEAPGPSGETSTPGATDAGKPKDEALPIETRVPPSGTPEGGITQPSDTSQPPSPAVLPSSTPGPVGTADTGGTPGPVATPSQGGTSAPPGTPAPQVTPIPDGTANPGGTPGTGDTPGPTGTHKPDHTPRPTRTPK